MRSNSTLVPGGIQVKDGVYCVPVRVPTAAHRVPDEPYSLLGAQFARSDDLLPWIPAQMRGGQRFQEKSFQQQLADAIDSEATSALVVKLVRDIGYAHNDSLAHRLVEMIDGDARDSTPRETVWVPYGTSMTAEFNLYGKPSRRLVNPFGSEIAAFTVERTSVPSRVAEFAFQTADISYNPRARYWVDPDNLGEPLGVVTIHHGELERVAMLPAPRTTLNALNSDSRNGRANRPMSASGFSEEWFKTTRHLMGEPPGNYFARAIWLHAAYELRKFREALPVLETMTGMKADSPASTWRLLSRVSPGQDAVMRIAMALPTVAGHLVVNGLATGAQIFPTQGNGPVATL